MSTCTVSEASPLLNQLRSVFNTAPYPTHDISKLLSRLKLCCLRFPINISGESMTPSEELQFQQEVLEHACFHALKISDVDLFLKSYKQYEAVYNNPQLQTKSEHYTLLSSCYLISLLSRNNFSEFHTQLETLPKESRDSDVMVFVIQLERSLMAGSYSFLLESRQHPPRPEFVMFLDSLISSSRSEIAECISKSFSKISIHDLTTMLSLSEADTVRFLKDQMWEAHDGVVVFRELQLPSHVLPAENILVMNNRFIRSLDVQ
ncbi:hypothetical protein RCL1_004588 [Eukaryota sp. TZLM3-RCL]